MMLTYANMNQRQRELYDEVMNGPNYVEYEAEFIGMNVAVGALTKWRNSLHDREIGDAEALAIAEALKVKTTVTMIR